MVSGILMKADGTVQFREVRDELEEWYTLLGCELIEVAQIFIGDHAVKFTVICDGEGLLNGNDTPMVFGAEKKGCEEYPIIVGNIFICKSNRNGEFESLSKEDASVIFNNIHQCEDGTEKKSHPVITGAHYF